MQIDDDEDQDEEEEEVEGKTNNESSTTHVKWCCSEAFLLSIVC